MKTIMKVLLVSAMLLPFAAQAAAGECNESLYIGDGTAADPDGYVAAAISGGIFTGKRAATDESHLISKLAAADGKVSLGKYSDAVDKLEDISDKATQLATATPKSKLDDATAINNAVTDAIGCVAALEADIPEKAD